MKYLFNQSAETAARQTGLVQRQVKFSGPTLVQTLVLGWLHQPQATLEQLTQMAATLDVKISPQGLDQRFTEKTARCLEQVLQQAVTQVIAVEPVAIPLLKRFSCLALLDSSTVALPKALAQVWAGCGETEAALKIQVRWDWCTGRLWGPVLQEGRCHDSTDCWQGAPLPKGSLQIADLGYFHLAALQELAQQGSYFLTRLRVGTLVFDPEGEPLELLPWLREQGSTPLDQWVQLGEQYRLPVRLIAVAVPLPVAQERQRKLKQEARRRGQPLSPRRLALAAWTILVTNLPQEQLSVEEALVLLRTRWQIELLFKLWKQQGQIDAWRSQKPWRVLCEVYAKLIGMLIQHWVLLLGGWAYADRSLVKGAQTIRSYALLLANALGGEWELTRVLQRVARCLAAGCRMNRRKAKPNTYQLLLACTDNA
jgi:hypothetical protein